MFALDEQASEKGGSSRAVSLNEEVLANHPPRGDEELEDEKSTPVLYPEGGLRGWSVVLGV